jgi:hypothetical protein
MLYAEYKREEVWASDFPSELADANTCTDGLEHYPRCPECDARVTHRNESIDGRAAHFAHCASSECDGVSVGERQEHTAMKSIAASAVRFALNDLGVGAIHLEERVGAPHSNAEYREADCLIEFEKPDEQLGDGLIIEVQYRNKNKDKNETMLDYLSLEDNYSVLWLWESDFYTTGDLPKDWNCKLVREQAVRDRVREQVWPVEAESAVWENPNENKYTLRASPAIPKIHTQKDVYEREVLETVRETKETTPPDAKVAGTAIDEIAAEYKESYDWEALFTAKHGDEYVDEVISQYSSLPKRKHEVRFPAEAVAERYLAACSWPTDFSASDKLEAIERWGERFGFTKSNIRQWMEEAPTQARSTCPECFHPHELDPIHPGEMTRGKTCRNCGTWFTVYDKHDRVSEVDA